MTTARNAPSYLLDGSDEDLARLLRIAEVSAPSVREAFARVGLAEGSRTLDCGCGPIGALAVMAETVGPGGQVVGIEVNADTAERARSVARALGHDNVQVHTADLHEVSADELGGPFDLAFTRCFLMHQPDLRRTLARIGALLRPGGWLVAQEPLPTPPPTAEPAVPQLARYWELIYETMRRLGAECAVPNLAARCREAGFQVVDMSGFFHVLPASAGFELHATTLAASKDRATAARVADAAEIDAVIENLRRAGSDGQGWVTSPFYLAVTAKWGGAEA
jgi:SAM-dependent methyltransferase